MSQMYAWYWRDNVAGISIAFYDNAPNELRHKYAVIIARYDGMLLWCRHHERQTWEIPGGHIEAGEEALEAAVRELQEETGTTDFTLQPVCWYSAWRTGDTAHSCGLLCVADVYELGELHSEIAEVRAFESIPNELTYPEIQPHLLAEAIRRGYV